MQFWFTSRTLRFPNHIKSLHCVLHWTDITSNTMLYFGFHTLKPMQKKTEVSKYNKKDSLGQQSPTFVVWPPSGGGREWGIGPREWRAGVQLNLHEWQAGAHMNARTPQFVQVELCTYVHAHQPATHASRAVRAHVCACLLLVRPGSKWAVAWGPQCRVYPGMIW